MANLGITQVPQTIAMNQNQKAALSFQAQPAINFNGQLKADMVTFGADPKIEAATEVVKQATKFGLLSKIAAPVIKVAKAVLAVITKFLKAINPIELVKKVSGMFGKKAAEVASKAV